MQLQDSFCIGFELGGGHFALPVQQIFGVFHDTNVARESKLLRLEGVLVYEGSPVCMRSAKQLITELTDYCDEAQITEITPQNHPWVLILKDGADQNPSKKGCGFRVQTITPPFTFNPVEATKPHYGGHDYTLIELKQTNLAN